MESVIVEELKSMEKNREITLLPDVLLMELTRISNSLNLKILKDNTKKSQKLLDKNSDNIILNQWRLFLDKKQPSFLIDSYKKQILIKI